MLSEWEELLEAGAFVKVMPHDYKRVLAERAEAQEALAARAAKNGAVAPSRRLDAVGK